ncbi:MAG: TIGR03032 family protein [Planctomycetota bacterium]|nr:TIGR03032 family protein [Planctomycetota bacterium]
MTTKLQAELESSRPPGPYSDSDSDSDRLAADQQDSPLRSVYTDNVPGILSRLRASLLVTTYQAGFLIVLRADGTQLNTHFRRFRRPMGMASQAGCIALGAAREVIEFRNMAALASKLDPPGKHDASYLPRKIHVTGDIDIHEMAYGTDAELWFVNTRFSCLCTLNDEHSFVPRWRPSFVSAYSPEDRCHLNGMGMVDGRPRFITALGATDSREGWRSNKAGGGVVVDVDSGETIAGGLSMPHSPRWYQDRLWMLESGDGSLGTVDTATGKYEAIARLDGFTRGLSFAGPFAFVGLSQVRESVLFSGLPLTERLNERICGVSIVDLRTGREVGFVRFEAAVQEVFSVAILPHCFPELLEPGDDHIGNSYALPDEALAEVKMQYSGEASLPPGSSENTEFSKPTAD